MWFLNSLAALLAISNTLIHTSEASRSSGSHNNRVHRHVRKAVGDASPAQVFAATFVASSIVATVSCGITANATSCLVFDVSAGFNNSLTFSENIQSITAVIQTFLSSNIDVGTSTISIQLLKAILPLAPTLDQIQAGDFYVAPTIDVSGSIIIVVRPSYTKSASVSATSAATLAAVLIQSPTVTSAPVVTPTPIPTPQTSSIVVVQPTTSSAVVSPVSNTDPAQPTSSTVVVLATSTITQSSTPATSQSLTVVIPDQGFSSQSTEVIVPFTTVQYSSTQVSVDATTTIPVSEINPTSTTIIASTTLASDVTSIPSTLSTPSVLSPTSSPAQVTTTSTTEDQTSSVASSTTVDETSSATSTELTLTSTTPLLSLTASTSTKTETSAPTSLPDLPANYQTPNTTLAGTVVVTYSTDSTLRYLSGEGFVTEQYGEESSFTIMTYENQCANYANSSFNTVSLQTSDPNGSFYFGFDMSVIANSTTYEYSQKFLSPSSNTNIFIIDCVTKVMTIDSSIGVLLCTNNDSVFITDESSCVVAGGQATEPIFTFVPSSTYLSVFNAPVVAA